jgi:hypothetical protein
MRSSFAQEPATGQLVDTDEPTRRTTAFGAMGYCLHPTGCDADDVELEQLINLRMTTSWPSTSVPITRGRFTACPPREVLFWAHAPRPGQASTAWSGVGI